MVVRFLPALAALTYFVALPARAQAENPELDDPYFGGEVMFGFAGQATIGTSAGSGDLQLNGDGGVDTELGIGGGVQYIHPLHRYFALGARFAVQTWRSDPEVQSDTGRNIAFDLSLVPQARLPLTRALELYLSIPVGLTLDLLNELDTSVNSPGIVGASVDADAGFGWNLAFMLGARFGLSRNLGLFTEVGYALHAFSHEVNFTGNVLGISGGAAVDVDVTWTQVALNAGLYF